MRWAVQDLLRRLREAREGGEALHRQEAARNKEMADPKYSAEPWRTYYTRPVAPTCDHPSGDYIAGVWVCASCFHQLDRRPAQTSMKPRGEGGGARQVIHHAPIAFAPNGVRLGVFVEWAVAEVISRAPGVSHPAAMRDVLDWLAADGTPFGASGIDWGRAGARDLAAEVLENYEPCGEGNA